MWRRLVCIGGPIATLAVPALIMACAAHATDDFRQAKAQAAQAIHQQQVATLSRERTEDRQELELEGLKAQVQAKEAELAKEKQDNADLQKQNSDLKQENSNLKAQTAYQPTRSGVQLVAYRVGPIANRFYFGYCTWYVATLRSIPWSGNAIDWWWNARSYAAEGSVPAVGAIMVTRESGFGHVALVTAVNGDGSWTVTEMNWAAWDVVDSRTIRPGQVPLLGFIY